MILRNEKIYDLLHDLFRGGKRANRFVNYLLLARNRTETWSFPQTLLLLEAR